MCTMAFAELSVNMHVVGLQMVHGYAIFACFNLLPNYEGISHSRSRIVVHELLPRTVLHI